MELERIPVAVLIISVVTVCFIQFFNSLASIDNTVTLNSDFNGTYNQMNAEIDRINQTQNILFSNGVNSQFGFVPTVQSVMSAGSIITGSASALNQMGNDMANKLPLPPVVPLLIGALLTIGIIFAIIKITMRVNKA